MANKILNGILIVSIVLVICIYFLYRGYGWPLGFQGVEALGILGILLVILFSFMLWNRNEAHHTAIQSNSIGFGLWVGLLWTIEIGMNNIVRPPLPARDIYDNIFWGMIAILILSISIYYAFKMRKFREGIVAGIWSGFATGAVACLTALVLIVFGMTFIASDELNIAEWSIRGATSNTPSMSVYFAYQTIAGAMLHLIILGIIMGTLLGIIGGGLGKGATLVTRYFQEQN